MLGYMSTTCPTCGHPIRRTATCQGCDNEFVVETERGPLPTRCEICKTTSPRLVQTLRCLACDTTYPRRKQRGRPPLRCPSCQVQKVPLLPKYQEILLSDGPYYGRDRLFFLVTAL